MTAKVKSGRLASLCGLFREIFDFSHNKNVNYGKERDYSGGDYPQSFKNLIYEFRDQLVMLDSDFAAILRVQYERFQ